MKYSTENMLLSLNRQFADLLLNHGYSVFWHASGASEDRVAGADKGVVTLVPEFPANRTKVVRLTAGSPADDEVAIPAFTLQVLGSPRRVRPAGLGDPEWLRERTFRIDGFVRDAWEHREIADLLYEWIDKVGSRGEEPLRVWDYREEVPGELAPLEVGRFHVTRNELSQGDEGYRYYIHLLVSVQYFE